MKLTIDIPEKMYLNAKEDLLCGGDILVKAIKNGIPHGLITEQEPCEDNQREFIELVVEYLNPDLCTYPEYRGKPYFSIKYRENGKYIVGYGSYKIEMISQWIKEYFMPSIQPKIGHWIDHQEGRWIYAQCSECGTVHDTRTNYCPNCGARMSESKYVAEWAESFAQGLRQGLQDGFSESENKE